MSTHPPMKLLVAVDLSELDSPTSPLSPAIELAKRLGATVDLATVDAMPLVTGFVRDPIILSTLETEMATLRKHHEAALDARLDTLPDALRGEAHYRQGAVPTQALCDLAQAQNADAIVVGTHGRRGLRRVLLGSVAEKTVRLSPVPVLVTRTSSADRTPAEGVDESGRVVLALDLQEGGLAERIATATRWAERLSAKLDLLYVAPDLSADLDLFTADAARVLEAEAKRVDQHQVDKLEALAEAIPEATRGAVRRLESRHTADAIAEASEHADLLMLHTHGRTGIGRAVFGSIASQVVRLATVPTLVFRQ